MTSLSHALIGASIAAKIPHPFVAGALAFMTHFVCDAIPHWDLGTNWRLRPKVITGTLAILETLFAIFVTLLIFSNFISNQLNLFTTVLLSLAPDWLEVPYYLLLPHPPRLFYYIYKAQSILHSRLKFPEGALTQVVVVVAFLFVGFIL